MLQTGTHSKSVRLFVEIAIAIIAITVSGVFTYAEFIYPRSEAEKLEKKVENLEIRIDQKLEHIETMLFDLKTKH